MLRGLEREGLHAASGSACTSRDLKPSHVLTAMGLPSSLAESTLRLSFSRETTEADTSAAADIIVDVALRLRRSRSRLQEVAS